MSFCKFFSKNINLVSVVGEDFPNKAINSLKEKGVDVKGLQIKEGRKTFFWSGKYHNNMNSRDTLKTELNVLEDFDPIVPKTVHQIRILNVGKFNAFSSKKGAGTNAGKTKTYCFRHHELLDG